jgi:MerR family transcriptional regulator, copper efflux regulator
MLTSGQAAKAAGVGVETLRFYERKGLLPKPIRRTSGYRVYPPESVDRLAFIKRAQRLGFTLKDVKDLLRLRDDPHAGRREVRAKTTEKIADIDAAILDLQTKRAELVSLAAECTGDGPAAACPIVVGLSKADDSKRITSRKAKT